MTFRRRSVVKIYEKIKTPYKTSARSGPSAIRSMGRHGICIGISEQLMAGFMFVSERCVSPGTTRVENEESVFTTPTRPEASSVCPTQLFAAPMIRGCEGACEEWKTSLIAWISIESPRDVPGAVSVFPRSNVERRTGAVCLYKTVEHS